MKTSKSCYFLAENLWTSRLELVAFSGLGLAGVVLITMATSSALQFAEDREAIIQALSTPAPAQVELVVKSLQAVTNDLRLHADAARSDSDCSPGRRAPEASQTFMPQSQIMVDGISRRCKIEMLP